MRFNSMKSGVLWVKKDKNCDPFDPNDEKDGDNWDHMAFDPEHRLVISVIPGKRTAENIHKLMEDFFKRTRGKLMRLITTDKYMPYKEAIRIGYGRLVNPEKTGKRGRPKKPYWEVPSGLIYAMVKKSLSRGRAKKSIKMLKSKQKGKYFIYRTAEWNRQKSEFSKNSEITFIF